MADFKSQKRRKSHVQNMGIFFLVAQDMILSHRAKFQLIINFFRVSMYFVVFLPDHSQSFPHVDFVSFKDRHTVIMMSFLTYTNKNCAIYWLSGNTYSYWKQIVITFYSPSCLGYRRQRRYLSVFESSCHLPTCLPHAAEASHCSFNC